MKYGTVKVGPTFCAQEPQIASKQSSSSSTNKDCDGD